MFNHCYIEDGKYYIFRHNDIVVNASNKKDNNSLNFYLVMARNHLSDIDNLLEFYQTKLELGHNILFVSIQIFHFLFTTFFNTLLIIYHSFFIITFYTFFSFSRSTLYRPFLLLLYFILLIIYFVYIIKTP